MEFFLSDLTNFLLNFSEKTFRSLTTDGLIGYLASKIEDWKGDYGDRLRREVINGSRLYQHSGEKLRNYSIPGGIAEEIIGLVPNHPSRAPAPATATAFQLGKPPPSSTLFLRA